ncbi:expressed unknown protein [Seminavis robusta]|uniref:Uncharacterized protein n=1 Tax=Seminavis robusta TaxID=568900 RepID=A0A9N8HWN5_9STRA|nr:expressed unknown protein [Seminavis robusta]|eukprot:Sro2256_g321060.1 n/a (173) ;mRNA; r:13322-13840
MARTIGQTQIPKMALELLQSAATCDKAAYKWKSQSLEDLALGMLIELALRENEQEAQFRAQLGIIKGQPAQKQNMNCWSRVCMPFLVETIWNPLLQVVEFTGCEHKPLSSDSTEKSKMLLLFRNTEKSKIVLLRWTTNHTTGNTCHPLLVFDGWMEKKNPSRLGAKERGWGS